MRASARFLGIAIMSAAFAASSYATTIVVDPDAATSDNQDISTFFPGVTLQAQNPTGPVYAVPSSFAVPTPPRVFGPSPNYPYWNFTNGQDLRATFDFTASRVSIDFVADAGGTLYAYDANGVVLGSDTQGCCSGTLTVTASGIKSILVVLVKGAGFDAGSLDHLVIEKPADYSIRYASNLQAGDSIINITNTGANGASLFGPGIGAPAGNLCVNVYAFSPDEQMVSCCSCLVTPNGLVHLTANNDLVSNTLTGIRPNSIVIKLLATGAGPAFDGASCTNSAALAGTPAFPLAAGMLAFGTTLHSASSLEPAPAGSAFSVTETPFLAATLHPDELASLAGRCTNIIGNGSTFGICRSCRMGGLGGAKQ